MNNVDIQQLTVSDMAEVNTLILDRLKSDVALVNQLGKYIVAAGGKRMRPQLVLLCAKGLGYQGERHIDLAAIIEFIHTATLLHDDVVDNSDLRRGRETANNLFGNEAAVLVGDFLYSRSFQMMVEVGNMQIMSVLAGATNAIAEGEVMQLMNVNDPDTSESRYLEVIRAKTAKLFEAACEVGALIAMADNESRDAIARYGMHLGTAFQIVDDVLDYVADASDLGKNLGDDLAEGKPTLPLIIAMERAEPDDRVLLRKVIEDADQSEIDRVLAIIDKTDAMNASMRAADQESKQAIDALVCLPESDYKLALIDLAHSSVARKF